MEKHFFLLPGVRAMVGVCGSPVEQREGGGMGGDCAAGCAVSVYVSACRALAWAVVGRAVWRRSLPSSAAAARFSYLVDLLVSGGKGVC